MTGALLPSDPWFNIDTATGVLSRIILASGKPAGKEVRGHLRR